MSHGIFSKYFKHIFTNQKQKHKESINLWHEVNTTKFEYFMADNKQEPWYYSKTSADATINI